MRRAEIKGRAGAGEVAAPGLRRYIGFGGRAADAAMERNLKNCSAAETTWRQPET